MAIPGRLELPTYGLGNRHFSLTLGNASKQNPTVKTIKRAVFRGLSAQVRVSYKRRPTVHNSPFLLPNRYPGEKRRRWPRR